MLSRDKIIRIIVSVNIVSWLLLLGLNLTTLLQGYDKTAFGVPVVVRGLLLNLFLVLVFFFFSTRYEENAAEGFVDRLIRLLDLAWVLALVSIVFRFGEFVLDQFFQIRDAQLVLLFYHVQIGLVTIFLTRTFFIWKRFVLYQRSRNLLFSWRLYEYALLASLFFNFFLLDSNSTLFYFLLVPLAAGGAVLSLNLRWVAYLTVADKWKAILLTLLIGLFCAYFFWNLSSYSGNTRLVTDLVHSVYILALFALVGGYSVLAFAVLLFNLPTSVVFEQKIEELLDFQKLTQSFQTKENESQVYETLLESTVKAAGADAAWLVVANENRQITHLLARSLPRQRVLGIEKTLAGQIG